MSATDVAFAGSIPALYDRYMGPLLFEPYARDIAARAAALGPQHILETAAGTGIVTEALARALPQADIVATDLNQAMLDVAAERVRAANVRFQQADAQALPFADGEFDLVLSQFGVMFFPDRVGAYREVRRVLKPGGRVLFLEHVRSQDPRRARWQDRLHGPWYAFGYGCNCNLDTLATINASGLRVEQVDHGEMPKAPPIVRPMIVGVAREVGAIGHQ
jgi:SAM-dependent methyltransferase